MDAEAELRSAIADFGRSLFERGYSAGSSGNISARVDGGLLITPTNSCLGRLDPGRISRVDASGAHLAGDLPSKELPLHLALYNTRPQAGAVVHLHAPHATALSCLATTDPADAIPALTPYVVMRVGRVPLLPYVRPGSSALGEMIRALGGRHAAVLLANHGPVVSAAGLAAAVYAAEELEETARLALLLHGREVNLLNAQQIAELAETFGSP
jgi:ribulose-5-phosphate 4-epimerase/fuculose-1-phosphate aldolase